MQIDFKNILTPAVLAYPNFITEDGVNKKLSGFEKNDEGFVPIYELTNEVSEEEALSIMLGEEQ